MEVPYLLFGFLIFISSFSFNNYFTVKRNIYSYSFFLFFCFITISFWGLRGYEITDWTNYYRHFKELPYEISSIIRINGFYEISYNIFQLVVKTIWNNYFFLQFISSVIDFVLLYKAIKVLGYKNIPLVFFCFWIFKGMEIEFNLLRNSKAMFIFLYSLKYICKERSFIRYLVLNLIGATFHISALLYIPLYFLLQIKIRKKHLFILFIVSLVFILKKVHISTVIFEAVCNVLPDGEALKKMQVYLINQNESIFSFIYIERIVSFLLFFCCSTKLEKKKENIIMLNLFYLYFFISMFAWDFYLIVQRVSLLFICANWFLFHELLYLKKPKYLKLFCLFVFFIYGSAKIYKDSNADSSNAYVFCFNEIEYSTKLIEFKLSHNFLGEH